MFWFSVEKWLCRYSDKLTGKRVVLFGSTGGIGNVLSRYILQLGGELITVDRSPEKANQLRETLLVAFPNARLRSLTADLENIESVNAVCNELFELDIDVIIHNAGAYSIPRKICSTGLDNVFQINFASPYYITSRLLQKLSQRDGRVVIVGSIAHNYSKTDPNDLDFRSRQQASLAYGNAKRFWMFSAFGLAQNNAQVHFTVTHPGITFTNITAHYPKWLFAIIKHPMKVIFMPPKRAALSVVAGIFENVPNGYWIGPGLFNIWGKPAVKKLRSASVDEQRFICDGAEQIYGHMLTEIVQ